MMPKFRTALACIKTLRDPRASILLAVLLCGDLTFFVLHSINYVPPPLEMHPLSIELDRGYAEIYQYLKFLSVIIILIFISVKKTSLHYVCWAAVFAYFLIDDSLLLHERVGGLIAAKLNLVPILGLRLQDYGELVFVAAVGSTLVLPPIWAYKTGTANFRKVSKDFALLILILIFFGVVVDMAHIAIKLGPEVEFVLGLMEDGGEMLTMSFIFWYAFLIMLRNCNSDYHLCDGARTFLSKRAS